MVIYIKHIDQLTTKWYVIKTRKCALSEFDWNDYILNWPPDVETLSASTNWTLDCKLKLFLLLNVWSLLIWQMSKMSHHIDASFTIFYSQAFDLLMVAHKQFYRLLYCTFVSAENRCSALTLHVWFCLIWKVTERMCHCPDFIRDMTNCFGHISVELVLCKAARAHWCLTTAVVDQLQHYLERVPHGIRQHQFSMVQKCSGLMFLSLLLCVKFFNLIYSHTDTVGTHCFCPSFK